MNAFDLNKNWEYVESGLQNPLLVNMLSGWEKTDLPHDYSMEKPRSKASPTEQHEGFTQGAGLYYKKSFVVDEAAAGKRFVLEFEGVAGVTQVWMNGRFVQKHLNPYTSFLVDVTGQVRPGENTLLLHTDSRLKPSSRWYVGTGLYRRVWLHVGEQIAVLPQGLRAVTTALNGSSATLAVSARLQNPGPACEAALCCRVLDGQGREVAVHCETMALATGGGEFAAELNLKNITPWCPETPALYTVQLEVAALGCVDTASLRTGLRTLKVNSSEGFLLNGKPLKLKGGCIHHDLGLLGAAAHPAAERRRVKLLMESGFNALRLAHNPFGPALFDICDELGMLVVEEAFDEWVLGRTSFGLHITFEDRWERDLEDMVNRDRHHPCIVMWSTGNEVEERDGSADGFAWAKRLAEKVKSLDVTRPVSATACSLFIEYTQRPRKTGDEAGGTTGNQALNMAYDNFASGVDLWGDTTAPYFAPLDVAGYNYKTVRYAHDGKKFPDRVIYGSESYPQAAFDSWQATVENPNVIGDFVWTAWDYLGEVGIGRWEVSSNPRPANPEWPWLAAYCSDLDLLGQKRPQSYYRDVVWGIAKKPRLFCLPPELTGKNIVRMSWTWLPVQPCYTFPGQEGQPLEAHIYADADEVELLQNGASLGRKPCGKAQEYMAVFSLPYQPGSLETVAYKNGVETGRDKLATAGPTASLILTADRSEIAADGADLCFVTLRALDAAGSPAFLEQGEATVTVEGGELLAFGSADPKPDRLVPYQSNTCPLFEGTAQAVVRSKAGAAGCLITATLGQCSAQLAVRFTATAPASANAWVREAAAGAVDLPLGELLGRPAARAVLESAMGPLLQNPMLEQMKGLSLKKLLAMSGQPLPAGLAEALNRTLQ